MANPDSTYKYYYTLASKLQKKKIPFWEALRLPGLECALWPALYPLKTFCESIITGGTTRESGKTAFRVKLYSQVRDYSEHFDLLICVNVYLHVLFISL